MRGSIRGETIFKLADVTPERGVSVSRLQLGAIRTALVFMDVTTWQVMFGSGHLPCMKVEKIVAWFVAVRGTILSTSRGARSGAGSSRAAGAPLAVCVSPGLLNPLFFNPLTLTRRRRVGIFRPYT